MTLRPGIKTAFSPLTNDQLRAAPVPVAIEGGVSLGDVTIDMSAVASEATLLALSAKLDELAVSGTFWQATQPVSAAALPLPAGASTAANQAALLGYVDGIEALLGGTLAVVGAVSVSNFPASQAVTGTFYPATQPVSAAALPLPTGAASAANQATMIGHIDGIEGLLGGTLTIAGTVAVSNFPATQAVSIAGTVAVSGPLTDTQLRATALPVSGAFYPATQPVSIAAMPSTPVTGTFWQATQPVSIAGTIGVSGPLTDAQLRAAALPVSLAAGSNKIGVTGDATDIGRVIRHFIMDTYVAAPVADALMTVTQWYNNAAVAGGTQPAVVPAGKVLRLTGARLSTKSLATAGSVVLRIRVNTGGLVVIGSPIVQTLEVGSAAAVAGLLSEAVISFPEGVDIPAGAGIGFSLAGYGPTGALTLQGVTRFEVWGYEYTA